MSLHTSFETMSLENSLSENILTAMQQHVSIKGRFTHMFLFEVVALCIFIPLFTFVLAKHAATLGLLAVVLSVCAMLRNFLYNWLFDVLERLLGGRRFSRKIWLRFVHAGVFELSLCLASVPFVISLLHDSFWHALSINLGFVFFISAMPLFLIMYLIASMSNLQEITRKKGYITNDERKNLFFRRR